MAGAYRYKPLQRLFAGPPHIFLVNVLPIHQDAVAGEELRVRPPVNERAHREGGKDISWVHTGLVKLKD